MRSFVMMIAASAVLANCGGKTTTVDDDYFDTINPTAAQQEAEARRLAGIQDDIQDTSQPLTTTSGSGDTIQQEIDRLLAAEGAGAELSSQGGVQTADTPTTPAPVNNNPTPTVPVATAELSEAEKERISNSQDFEAVTARETIETDAAKLAELKRTYQVFEPESLTLRGQSVNLATYASENAGRQVGKKRYTRRKADYKEGGNFCAEYADQDLAQIAFLNNEGPRKDPLLIDQDGDGFACGWTPRAYQARRSANLAAPRAPSNQ